jgi:hypothetical protein
VPFLRELNRFYRHFNGILDLMENLRNVAIMRFQLLGFVRRFRYQTSQKVTELYPFPRPAIAGAGPLMYRCSLKALHRRPKTVYFLRKWSRRNLAMLSGTVLRSGARRTACGIGMSRQTPCTCRLATRNSKATKITKSRTMSTPGWA